MHLRQIVSTRTGLARRSVESVKFFSPRPRTAPVFCRIWNSPRLHRTTAAFERTRVLRGYHFDFSKGTILSTTAAAVRDTERTVMGTKSIDWQVCKSIGRGGRCLLLLYRTLSHCWASTFCSSPGISTICPPRNTKRSACWTAASEHTSFQRVSIISSDTQSNSNVASLCPDSPPTTNQSMPSKSKSTSSPSNGSTLSHLMRAAEAFSASIQ